MNAETAQNPVAHGLARRTGKRLGTLAKVLAAVALSGALAPTALGASVTGGSYITYTNSVHLATNTIATTAGTVIDYEVRAWSDGDKYLTIIVCQKDSAGNYEYMEEFGLYLDGTGDACTTTFSYTVTNHRSGSTEYVKLFFMKPVFSARIDFWWKGTY